MAEADGELQKRKRPRARPEPPEDTPDPIEIAMKAVATGADRHGAARAVLEKHACLIDIQCRREREELANVRVQRITRWLILAAVAALLLGLSALMVSAVKGEALVVEPFRVPPALTQAGMGGEVMATRVMDQIAQMQSRTLSSRPASTYSTNWDSDLKVAIPNTGATLGDLRRMLRNWFGRETQISGEVVRTATGWNVTSRVSGRTAISASDPDLERATTKAAEGIFQQTQPYRYVIYLRGQGRIAEAIEIAKQQSLNGTAEDRAWGLVAYANSLGPPEYGAVERIEALRRAAEAVPDFPMPLYNYGGVLETLGRHEQALALNRKADRTVGDGSTISEQFRDQYVASRGAYADALTGAYSASAAKGEAAGRVGTPAYATQYIQTAIYDRYAVRDIQAGDRNLRWLFEISGYNAQTGLIGSIGDIDAAKELRVIQMAATIRRAIAIDDRQALSRNLPGMVNSVSALLASFPPTVSRDQRYAGVPRVAPALARIGQVGSAETLLRELPADCYPCAVARGEVAAIKGDKAGAAKWFAHARRLGPSLPFADEALGRMLLAANDLEGAESAFASAIAAGPQYADALKGAGDVLARKRMWREAAARYAAAAKQAPRWGKLHLHWAHALARSGNRKGAMEVLQSTGSMVLGPADAAIRKQLTETVA
ncbi:MAG TPA: hypothetical protein VNT25_01510 [Allosphingosinicella sp.]|nr:hypothetical protein [Allosphingosinicella sp.]